LKKPGVKLIRVALALTLASLSIPSMTAPAAGGDKSNCHKKTHREAVLSTEQKANGHRWVKAKILIKATPHVVWETVHEERQKDPDLEFSRVLSTDPNTNQATLEQKFALIPVFGTATCVMKNVEVPFERIDYNMISSDRFKALEGSWVLTPGKEPNETYLELSTYCDMGIPVPRMMLEGVTGKKLQRRLANVRNMAEATQTRLARK
jgi:hypothetical protein